MSNLTVIIPTYWTWASGDRGRPALASYDHPTPLDGESTLPPLLDDLGKQQEKNFRVLILAGLTHPDLRAAASTPLRALLKPYQDRLEIHLCDDATWARLKAMMELSEAQSQLLHLGSYSGVRNLQLLIPHILGSEIIVALDDDERVEPDYMQRVLKYIGKTVNGQRVSGLAGPYLQRDGSVLLQESSLTGNPLLDKSHHINQAMRALNRTRDAPVPSPIALGGNMVFHRDLFTQVCFDPGITRGEDIDYLINARLQGIPWWFDANLAILHLPPHHYDTPPYQRTREDVFRFLYELEKLRLHGHSRPEWLEPYPGALLAEDLVDQALAALQVQATPDLTARFGEPQAIVEQAQAHAAHYAPLYGMYQRAWRDLMSRLEREPVLRHRLATGLVV